MSRYQKLQNFFERGGAGTDAELAKRFASQHEPKRGAEIIRSTICTLIKKNVHICKQSVDGQRKQEYYIPFARPLKAKAPVVTEFTFNGVVYDCYPRY